MASEENPEIAPEPPAGLLPSTYIAIRCQMCGRWSTSLAPWPLNQADKDKWGPLLPWGQGSRDQPSGLNCRLCTTVHAAGGWADAIGNIKKCRAEFIKAPTKHHLWIDQVEVLIKLKTENPSIRIRSGEQLGPNIVVAMQQMVASTVKGPAVYCVEPGVFREVTGNPAPSEKLVSENIEGTMTQVVLCQGKIWHECYKDGVEGVYKKNRSTTTAAVKTTYLNDSELNLGDDVIDALYKRAMNAIKGNPSQMKMAIRDDSEALSSAAASCPPTRKSALRLSASNAATAAKQAQMPSPSPSDVAPSPGHGDDHDPRRAMWAAFAPTQVATPMKPVAKLPKAKAKAGNGGNKRAAKPQEEEKPPKVAKVESACAHPSSVAPPVAPAPAKREGGSAELASSESHACKVARTSATEKPDASSAGGFISPADLQWIEETHEQFSPLLDFNAPKETNEWRKFLGDKEKALKKLQNTVKNRRRTCERRAEPSEAALDALSDLLHSIGVAHKLVKMVGSASFSGDEAIDLYQLLEKKKGVTVVSNDKWWMRVLKYKINDDLRWKRWKSMGQGSFALILKKLPESGMSFFGSQMAIVLQKLLKSLSVDKVSMDQDSEDMKELRSFARAMKVFCVPDRLKVEFEIIDRLLHAGDTLPDDVESAIQKTRSSCATAGNKDFLLLPTLEALATGKRLLELADETRKSRTEAFAFLHEIAEARAQVAELKDPVYSEKSISSYKMTAFLVIKVDEKVPENHKHMLQEIDKGLEAAFEKLVASWLEVDVKPWLSTARSGVLGSGILPKLPSFIGDALFKDLEPLECLYKPWRAALEELSLVTKEMEAKTIDAGQVCKAMSDMTAAHNAMKKHWCFGKLRDMMSALLLSLQRISEEYYSATFCDTMALACTALTPSILDTTAATLFQPIEECAYHKSIEMCDKASFLTTGLNDREEKNKLVLAVRTVRALIVAAFHYTQNPEDLVQVIADLGEVVVSMDAFGSMQRVDPLDVCMMVNLLNEDLALEVSCLEANAMVVHSLAFMEKLPLASFQEFCVKRVKLVREEAFLLKNRLTTSLKSLTEEVSALDLPLYKDTNVQDFNRKITPEILQTIGDKSQNASKCIDYVQSIIKKFKLPADYFSEMKSARAAAKYLLTSMTTATAARILCSKAASKKTGPAKSHAVDCLKFCQDNLLEIPAELQAQLSDLAAAGSSS